MGIVRFRNDQVAAIIGYDDYQIGNVTISRVYYVKGLGHNLFSVVQFCDSDLEAAFQKHSCFVHDLEGVDLIKGSKGTNLYTLSLEDMLKSSPIYVIEKQDQNLVEAARTMLIFSKASLFIWAEAVATTCYTQNRSLIRTPHNKTPYELMHDQKPDLKYLHVFGSLCYPTDDNEDLGKLKPKFDIGIFIGYSLAKQAYQIYNKWTRMIMETIHVEFDELTAMASEQFDWDILFQPMFDEYFRPSPSVASHVPPAVAPIPTNTTDTATSTSIDQDAPSASTSPTTS
ncbi:retrovirus-related pol polyprotein from transposon TNT 1-94 [Tanacetum coccineum]